MRTPKPVPPVMGVLDLWSLGHTASQIAKMLGLPSHKLVTKIVAQAREIGDPRAVIHAYPDGRPVGRSPKLRAFSEETVPALLPESMVRKARS